MSVSKISQEVLSKYQVRKTKTQKTEFIEFLKQQLGDKHKVVVEQSGMFKSRNIIVIIGVQTKNIFYLQAFLQRLYKPC